MSNLIDFSVVKFTGKAGFNREVNCIGFKSIDTVTSDENTDALNYPVYEPYLTSTSYSYENWIKFKLKLNLDENCSLNSTGLTVKKYDNCTCYERTFTKLKNISLWISNIPQPNITIRVGTSSSYIRPVNTLSKIAIEDINTYRPDEDKFEKSVNIPLLYNGLNEIPAQQINNAFHDFFIVFQLEVSKGNTYQLDYRRFQYNIHYELV